MNKKGIWVIVVLVIVVIGVWYFKDNPLPRESPQSNTPAASVEGPTDASVRRGEVKEFTVTGKSFSFSPALLTVKKGDKVRLTFKNTQGFHDWKIDEFNAATKQIPANTEETIEFVADKVGRFEYYCSVGEHRALGMKGTLVVEN